MIGETLLPVQMEAVGADVINLVAIGLLLLFAYSHIQHKQAKSTRIKRRWRKRSAGILIGFAFYAVVIATWGPSGTWVGTVGRAIDADIQEFATQLFLIGEGPTQSTFLDQLLVKIKTLGLVAYIVTFSAVSFSNSLINKIATFVKNIP